MKPWLYVGAKVLAVGGAGCSDPKWANRMYKKHPITSPKVGEVYTVRSIRESCVGYLAITVEEIINPMIPPPDGQGLEADFYIGNFRPVSTIDTTKQVEALRSLMLDATVRGKVSA